MARLSREFVKLETRILNDWRFFTMNEFEQLVYVKLLGISRSNSNQIPKNLGILKELLRLKKAETGFYLSQIGFSKQQIKAKTEVERYQIGIKSALKRIKANFPKFKENKYFYCFDDYEARLLNSAPTKEGNSGVDEDKDVDRDKDEDKDNIKKIIEDLNFVLGTSYKHTSAKTREFIKARFNEGFSLEDFKVVHRKMLRAWGADAKMAAYLRPITLYSNKFEGYLNRKEVTTKLTETGIRAYLIGQEWLKKQEVIDVK